MVTPCGEIRFALRAKQASSLCHWICVPTFRNWLSVDVLLFFSCHGWRVRTEQLCSMLQLLVRILSSWFLPSWFIRLHSFWKTKWCVTWTVNQFVIWLLHFRHNVTFAADWVLDIRYRSVSQGISRRGTTQRSCRWCYAFKCARHSKRQWLILRDGRIICVKEPRMDSTLRAQCV